MKKRHLKSGSSVIGLIFIAFVVMCFAGPAIGQTYKWKCGVPTALDSAQDKAAREVSELLKKRTNGQIVIDVYPGGQLGSWPEVFDGTVRGTVDLAFSPISPQFNPKLQMVYMVYLVDNWKDGLKAYASDGWIFKFLAPVFENLGLKPLDFCILGFGGYGSTKGPVLVPEDISKLRLKTRAPLLTTELFFKKLGPTVNISFSELFTSLQTGVCDAQDNSPSVTFQQLRDVTKFYTTINHLFEPLVIIINKKLWDGLKPELQKTVSETTVEVMKKYNGIIAEEDDMYLKKMKEQGIKVTELTAQQREPWVKLGRSTWDELANVVGKDSIEYVKKNAPKP